MPAYHFVIKGKVQGVFYRQSAKEVAKELGLIGWVRNMTDGSVEAVACGDERALQNFMRWCRTGPPQAHVTDIIIEPCPEVTEDNFVILQS